MKTSYDLSKSYFPKYLISKHWNIYPSEFREILFKEENIKDFRSNEISFKFNDSLEKGMYSRTRKVFNKLRKITGQAFIEQNKEIGVGNPKTYKIDKECYDYHDLFLIYFFYTLLPFLSERNKKNIFISDIGGGYGGLIHLIKKNFPNSVCLLFDLPEQNYVSNYYLQKLNPKAKILNLERLVKLKKVKSLNSMNITKDDIINYDYVILPGYLIKNFDNNLVDIFINTRSFMEMNLETVDFYFSNIQKKIKDDGLFYCVNRYQKKTSGDLIKFKYLPFDEKWKFLLSRRSFHQPMIHEAMLQRVRSKNNSLKKILSRLKPYDIEFFKSFI